MLVLPTIASLLLPLQPLLRTSNRFFDMADTSSFADCSGQQFLPNAIVSKGGDGNFTTLTDAVKAIPSSAKGRYIIYVKNGVYDENVTISRSKVTLIGDGKGKTIIRSHLNNKGKITIQDSGAVSK